MTSVIQIQKRDTTKQAFDEAKIYNAVLKAFKEVHDSDLTHVQTVTDYVVQVLESYSETITIETIQDIVVVSLMHLGHYKVAEKYILYRDKKTKERKQKEKILDTQYIDAVSKQLNINQLLTLKERYLICKVLPPKEKGGKQIRIAKEQPSAMFERVAKTIAIGDLVHDLQAPVLDIERQTRPLDEISFNEKIMGNKFYEVNWPLFNKYNLNAYQAARMLYLFNQIGSFKYRLLENVEIGDDAYELKITPELAAKFELYFGDSNGKWKTYYNRMVNGEYMFNTPVLMNFGRALGGGNACFVLALKDDLYNITHTIATRGAQIYKKAGGCGFNFSYLRPEGDIVGDIEGGASGITSWITMVDNTTNAIKAGTGRRGANMGVLNCLSGDTLIHTLEGKIPIRELVNANPLLYCLNDQGELRIRKAEKIIHNGTRKLLRIKFDNDDWIDCTPDHKIMLSDGTYKEAGQLKQFDSVMAFYKTTYSGRYHVSTTISKNAINEQILSIEYKTGQIIKQDGLNRKSNDLCTHHIDENPLNNDPENIEILTVSEHAKMHSKHLLQHQKQISKQRKGKSIEELYGVERANEIKEKMRKARLNKIPWNKGLQGDEYLSHYEEGIKNQFSNHKVISITELQGEHDVYDIIMKDYHNFVANGVFVHNCDHPEIETFINAKKTPKVWENLNVSVGTDATFWNKVYNNENFDLINPRDKSKWGQLNARDFFTNIAQSAHASGEPGLLFFDNTNKFNPFKDLYGNLNCTNPCGEQYLYPNDSCTLGSVNVGKFIDSNGFFMKDDFIRACKEMTRGLDNVVSLSKYPDEQIEQTTKSFRRIGIGIMGVADALYKMRIGYNTEEGYDTMTMMAATMHIAALEESIDLAQERGQAPNWKKLRQVTGKNSYDLVKEKIEGQIDLSQGYWLQLNDTGIRNCWVGTEAPTGTIAMISGCSSGIEPLFGLYYRKVLDDQKTEFLYWNEHFIQALKEEGIYSEELLTKIVENGSTCDGIDEIPEWIKTVFVTAMNMHWADHIYAQSVWQQYVDNSISKTINMPKNATVEDVKQAYFLAHELHCKGLSIYRNESRHTQILHLKNKDIDPIPSEFVTEVIRHKFKHIEHFLPTFFSKEWNETMQGLEEIRIAADNAVESFHNKDGNHVFTLGKEKEVVCKCGTVMVPSEGCSFCPQCGFSPCSK